MNHDDTPHWPLTLYIQLASLSSASNPTMTTRQEMFIHEGAQTMVQSQTVKLLMDHCLAVIVQVYITVTMLL